MRISFAICPPTANCLPSACRLESGLKPHHSWLFVRRADGNCHLRLPTCQLPESEAIQGLGAVGKLAEIPLLLRSIAVAAPKQAAAQLRHISNLPKGKCL